jgi:hypothetical protein
MSFILIYLTVGILANFGLEFLMKDSEWDLQDRFWVLVAYPLFPIYLLVVLYNDYKNSQNK